MSIVSRPPRSCRVVHSEPRRNLLLDDYDYQTTMRRRAIEALRCACNFLTVQKVESPWLPRDVFNFEEVGIVLNVVRSGLVQVARLSQKSHLWHYPSHTVKNRFPVLQLCITLPLCFVAVICSGEDYRQILCQHYSIHCTGISSNFFSKY